MNTRLPISRRRLTQPIRTTCWPECSARSSPHLCVRRRSAKKSSGKACVPFQYWISQLRVKVFDYKGKEESVTGLRASLDETKLGPPARLLTSVLSSSL